jgi:hypothetical protein
MEENKFFKIIKTWLFIIGLFGFVIAIAMLYFLFSGYFSTNSGQGVQNLFLFTIASILLMGFFKNDI